MRRYKRHLSIWLAVSISVFSPFVHDIMLRFFLLLIADCGVELIPACKWM
jgi:hypothetical protein